MIQLEQKQHREFWVGGVGWVTYQLPISSSPVAGSTNVTIYRKADCSSIYWTGSKTSVLSNSRYIIRLTKIIFSILPQPLRGLQKRYGLPSSGNLRLKKFLSLGSTTEVTAPGMGNGKVQRYSSM